MKFVSIFFAVVVLAIVYEQGAAAPALTQRISSAGKTFAAVSRAATPISAQFLSGLQQPGLMPMSKPEAPVYNNRPLEQAKKAKSVAEEKKLAHQRVRYDGIQLWQLTKEDFEKIHDENDDLGQFIHCTFGAFEHRTIAVKKSGVGEMEKVMKNAEVEYQVVSTDYQKLMDNENPSEEFIKELQKDKPHKLTWQAYHRMDDIDSFLDYLNDTSELCSLVDFGYSAEGRPIKVIKVSNGNPNNKAIWLDGGMHAREWITPAAVTAILRDLVADWDKHPELHNLNFYIAPVLNPGGYEYSHETNRLWRKNRNTQNNSKDVGVDLNRNYDNSWEPSDESSDSYNGPHAFSEPETRAHMEFFRKTTEKFTAFLTFHSDFRCILYPWGHTEKSVKDAPELRAVAEEAANEMRLQSVDKEVYRFGDVANTVKKTVGSSVDWAKEELKIKYSYVIELPSDVGFILAADKIEAVAKEAKAATFVIAKHAANAE